MNDHPEDIEGLLRIRFGPNIMLVRCTLLYARQLVNRDIITGGRFEYPGGTIYV